MTTNFTNQSPYLRASRHYPQDLQPLAVEVNKSYVDIANAVNSRTIGVFAQGKPSITGESWFLTANKQQTIRQVYPITTVGSYDHNINTADIGSFTRIYGTATDGTKWYPLPYVDAVAANNQISVSITSTQIVITAGAGAPPIITSGTIVLEWLSPV